MNNKQNKQKRSRSNGRTAQAVLRLMAVTGFTVAGMVLLGWVTIPDQAKSVVGAFLVAIAVTLTFLWFQYDKVKF